MFFLSMCVCAFVLVGFYHRYMYYCCCVAFLDALLMCMHMAVMTTTGVICVQAQLLLCGSTLNKRGDMDDCLCVTILLHVSW